MKKRSFTLRIMLTILICLGVGINSFGVQEEKIRISPLSIQWNDNSRQFEAFFDVVNQTEEAVDLTSIIIFKRPDSRRYWRGARLPLLEAGSRQHFKLAFPPAIMLKRDYSSITVNIYGKDYDGLIDYSSKYLKVKSQRLIDGEKARVEITEIRPSSDKSGEGAVTKLIELADDRETLENISSRAFTCELATIEQDAGSGKISQTEIPLLKPEIMETPISELLGTVEMEAFSSIEPVPELLVEINDKGETKAAHLKLSRDLEVLDIGSRDQLLALYIAEGKSDVIASALSDLHAREPENMSHTLSLSKVYHEQGDTRAALKVLTSSLNRISISARVSLNQVLNKKGKQQEAKEGAVSDDSYLADEFNKLGISLLEQKHYTDAVSAFQSLYTLKQNYPLINYHLGLSRMGLKQYHQAKQLFIKQSREDIERKQLLDNLSSLTEALQVTLDLPDIQSTKSLFQALLQQAENSAENKRIWKNITILDSLMVKVEENRLASLPDLGITLATPLILAEVQPGQELTAEFLITNSGKATSGNYQVNYQLKHEAGMLYDIPANDRFKPLEGNDAAYVWKKQFPVPTGVLPGTYRLVARIEQVQDASEVTHDNNTVLSEPAVAVFLLGEAEKNQLALLTSKIEALRITLNLPELLKTEGQFQALLQRIKTPAGSRLVRRKMVVLPSLLVKAEEKQLQELSSQTEALGVTLNKPGILKTKSQFQGFLALVRSPARIKAAQENIAVLDTLLTRVEEKQVQQLSSRAEALRVTLDKTEILNTKSQSHDLLQQMKTAAGIKAARANIAVLDILLTRAEEKQAQELARAEEKRVQELARAEEKRVQELVRAEEKQVQQLASRAEALGVTLHKPEILKIKSQSHDLLKRMKTPAGIKAVRVNITVLNNLLARAEEKQVQQLSSQTEVLRVTLHKPEILETKSQSHDLLLKMKTPAGIRVARENIIILNALLVKAELGQVAPLISKTEELKATLNLPEIRTTISQIDGLLQQMKTPEGIKAVLENITVLDYLLDKAVQNRSARQPDRADKPAETTKKESTI